MRFAPGGSGDSTLAAYDAFSVTSCDDVTATAEGLDEPGRTLYASAGAACSAAFRDRPDLWAQAEDGLRRLESADPADFACFDDDARAMLAALVRIHHQSPGTRIMTAPEDSTAPTTCPRITAVQPDHGALAGGETVVVTGVNLQDAQSVDFGVTSVAAVPGPGGTTATVVTPAGDTPGWIDVSVSGYFWASIGVYEYEEPPVTVAGSGSPVPDGG
ncbi:IPT/TIG domain-containing protein [Actinoplanes missouriensis]|uniref:IPT/TIG domain-containing protein n=1 Tax=Actinoplanes missouriensis TaxID=1866 RepID=UPI0033DFF49E